MRKRRDEMSEKMIDLDKKNVEILRERLARGEISAEKFDKLADKLDPIQRDRRTTLIVVLAVICVIIAFGLYAMYLQYSIDCHQPISNYWWAENDYLNKCGHS